MEQLEPSSGSAQIVHVVFADTVGYTRLSMEEKRAFDQVLAGAVRSAVGDDPDIVRIDNGDGFALGFFGQPTAAAEAVVVIHRALRDASPLKMRLGVHSGPAYRRTDIAGKPNLTGPGVEKAQRVMSIADGDEILVSEYFAENLRAFSGWADRLTPLGERTVKHGDVMRVWRLDPEADATLRVRQKRVVIAYRRNAEPDGTLLKSLSLALADAGIDVFNDQHLRVGVAWATEIERRIKACDAIVALVSESASESEMMLAELEIAHTENQANRRPEILPVRIGSDRPVGGPMGALINHRHFFAWRSPADDAAVGEAIVRAILNPGAPPAAPIAQPQASLAPTQSDTYVERSTDRELRACIERRDSIVLIKGPRQIGKTSLLGRGLEACRAAGWRTVLADLQSLGSAEVADEGAYYRWLIGQFAIQLDVDPDSLRPWTTFLGPQSNFELVLRRDILEKAASPIVWAIDEADKIFRRPFAEDFFGLLRSWHNRRVLESDGPWGRLTVMIAYATDAQLFITNLNQSPFNVGVRLDLKDFTIGELEELNTRFGAPLPSPAELRRLLDLTGGHPYLSVRALTALREANGQIDRLEAVADREEGPFGDHLRHLLVTVSASGESLQAVRLALEQKSLSEAQFSSLRSAGVVLGPSGSHARLRNSLYERYLRRHLLLEQAGQPSAPARDGPDRTNVLSSPLALVDLSPPANAAPSNLPQALTSFVGRENQVDEVAGFFATTRLVTLTGSGGCGKTRLALRVADSMNRSGRAAWFVELDVLSEPSLVPQAVARALGLKEVPGKPIEELVLGHLLERDLLLIIDNCEHVLDAVAQLSSTILRTCPGVQILATSRQALGISGETTYRVPSLSLPDSADPPSASTLPRSEAVRLFIERARLHQPFFTVTNDNAPAVAAVCRRLDGIPLALELAAARVRYLSVEDINARLDQQFQLLTGGSRNALPRQQTLRSLFDWSYELLTEAEKRLLARISVFAGGWTLGAAERVASGGVVEEWATLDLLSSLGDKSLVIADTTGQTARYRLLESVRQYSRDRLADSGEADSWRRRHLEYFLTLAEEAEPHMMGPEQARWRDRLEVEHDNLRAALEWGVSQPSAQDDVLRLAGSLWRFWDVRGHLTEARAQLARVIECGAQGDPRALGKVLHGAGTIAFGQADFATAQELLERALAIRRMVGDLVPIAGTINNLGNVAWAQGDLETARIRLEESLALSREANALPGVAGTLLNLGNLALDQGDLDLSGRLYEESLAIRRTLADQGGVATCLNNLGSVAARLGQPDKARALLLESLGIERGLGDKRGMAESLLHLGILSLEQEDFDAAGAHFKESLRHQRDLGARLGISTALFKLGELAAATGSTLRAARLWGASERLRNEIGSPLAPADQDRLEHWTSVARAEGDGAEFHAAWTEGRGMELEAAVDVALDSVGRR